MVHGRTVRAQRWDVANGKRFTLDIRPRFKEIGGGRTIKEEVEGNSSAGNKSAAALRTYSCIVHRIQAVILQLCMPVYLVGEELPYRVSLARSRQQEKKRHKAGWEEGAVVAWWPWRLTQRMAQFPKKRTRAHSTRGWLSIITMAVAHPMGRTTFFTAAPRGSPWRMIAGTGNVKQP